VLRAARVVRGEIEYFTNNFPQMGIRMEPRLREITGHSGIRPLDPSSRRGKLGLTDFHIGLAIRLGMGNLLVPICLVTVGFSRAGAEESLEFIMRADQPRTRRP